jgi:hypothetical protein
MKLVISTIVVGILLFVLGFLAYGVLLADYFKTHAAMPMRSPEDMKMWAFAAGSLLRALFLAMIYPAGYKGGSPAGEGFKFGLYMGLFFALPTVFFMWGSAPITYQTAIVDGLSNGIMILLAGLVTGLIYGKKEKTAAA